MEKVSTFHYARFDSKMFPKCQDVDFGFWNFFLAEIMAEYERTQLLNVIVIDSDIDNHQFVNINYQWYLLSSAE